MAAVSPFSNWAGIKCPIKVNFILFFHEKVTNMQKERNGGWLI